MKFWNDGFTAVFNYDKEDKIMKNTDQIKTPVDVVVGMNQVLQQRIKELKAENQRLEVLIKLKDRLLLLRSLNLDVEPELFEKIKALESK